MGLFQAFDISASGMTAQRFRTDIISENVQMSIQRERWMEHRTVEKL